MNFLRLQPTHIYQQNVARKEFMQYRGGYVSRKELARELMRTESKGGET